MGRARARAAASSSSSSYESTSNRTHHHNVDLSTDLRLGLSADSQQLQHFTSFQGEQDVEWPTVKRSFRDQALDEEENECNSATFYVKVYMDGIPIGRKLDLLAHDGYHDLIRTLDHMFCTNILWAEADVDAEHYGHCHVLTYEDKEGDWMMVGDVPWEMFLSTVRRLKITKC